METESKKKGDGTRSNSYYCPDFGERLLKLCEHFPLWTHVMSALVENISKFHINKSSSVATSIRSEEYFREVKNLIFKDVKTIRVDKFIILHLRSLSGTMKLLNAANSSVLQQKIESDCSSPTFVDKETLSHDIPDVTVNDTIHCN